MKAIVIVADTVRRDYLSIYGNSNVITPNLERLRARSVRFDNHWSGSLPCMPARHDMLTGRLNFLERNWGGIEPFDDTLPQMLRRRGIFSHMCTDHYHYFETGAENYAQQFNTWELIRGQEDDPWVSLATPYTAEPPRYGKMSPQYDRNRTRFRSEADYPSPRTFQAAIDWLDANREASDYLLWVEAFDPHEPFDVPQHYLDLYGDTYDGPPFMWPEYKPCDLPADALQHIRTRYAALLTMTDAWIGKLLDKVDELDLWKDTSIVFTTDHGYLFGEHGCMAKNYMPMYNEINHLPLVVHLPGDRLAGACVDALTQNIDLAPTLVDLLAPDGVKPRNKLHGKSWLPLLNGETERIRDYALYGYFGKNVNITNGTHTYFRAAVRPDNSPISLYTAMPTTFWHYLGHEYIADFARIETGRFLQWTDYPVYKFAGDLIELRDKSQAFNCLGEHIREHLLFDLQHDYGQLRPLADPQLEAAFLALLKRALAEHDAPPEQYARLGLA
ncbi:MAG: sulfatase-like hydrolase/transferase [Paenibacillaceae bacterium]|nr:sulfatase-like hydrolase/transferase [Paenibacillaceae bacterium]